MENQYLALNYELSLSLFYNFINFSSSYIYPSTVLVDSVLKPSVSEGLEQVLYNVQLNFVNLCFSVYSYVI